MNQQDKGQSESQIFALPFFTLNKTFLLKDKKSTNKKKNYESIIKDKCVFDEFRPTTRLML